MVAREIVRLAKVGAISAGITLFVVNEVGIVARIEGNSMQPTFNPSCGQRNESFKRLMEKEFPREVLAKELKTRISQDRVFLNKWAAHDKSQLRIGDVVILTSPKEPSKTLIKRIAAMPGDVIHIFGTGETCVIKEGHCWVEGDNQQSSYDSNNFGQVPLGLIQGRVCYIVWPLSRIRRIVCDPTISLSSTKTMLVNHSPSPIH